MASAADWDYILQQDPDFPPAVPSSFDVWDDDAEQQELSFDPAFEGLPTEAEEAEFFEDLPDEVFEEDQDRVAFRRHRAARSVKTGDAIDDEDFLRATHVKVENGAFVSIVGFPFSNDMIFFIRQTGVVVGYVPSLNFSYTFMDISHELNRSLPRDGRDTDLGKSGLRRTYEERGILSLAFEPTQKARRVFFTFTLGAKRGVLHQNTADIDHLLVLASTGYRWMTVKPHPARDTTVRVPIVSRRMSIHTIPHWLEVPHPSRIHIGGHILFDPSSITRPVLFMATGDGGRWGDESYAINAQDYTQSLLGAILRLDVGASTKNAIRDNRRGVVAYGIPETNPYAKGEDGRRPEIWAKGLRNCSGFTVHPSVYRKLERLNDMKDVDEDSYVILERSVQLTVAHVGGKEAEAIQTVSAGENLGWPIFEAGFVRRTRGDVEPVKPSIVYSHPDGDGFGTAVMGGRFYENTADHYIFGDFGINHATDKTSDYKGSAMVTRLTEVDREDDVRVRNKDVRTVALRGYVKAIGSTFDGKRIFFSVATHTERARGICRIYEVANPAAATGYGC